MSKKIILFLISFVCVSCQTSSVFNNSGFQLRSYQEETLENGLRILYIPDDSLPLVQISMLIKVGTLNEMSGDEGLNFITANLLEQGTAHRSATKIADELGQIASDFQATAGADFTLLNISTIFSERKAMLDLFSDIVMNPAFKSDEVERMRSQQLAMIRKSTDNPSGFADQLIDREIFGKHPYASPVFGSEKSVRLFTRTDIMKNYLKYYRPNNSILALTGKFDEDFKQQVRKALSVWQKRDLDVQPEKSLAQNAAGSLKLFTKQGLQQSQIRFSEIGPKRSNPDFFKLRLGMMILGGSFSSRLNQRIRDDLGLTYSIHSSLDARKDTGSVDVSTFTRNDKLAETVLETKKMIQEFVENGVTQTELDDSKALMSGQFPAAIETTAKLAQNLMLLRFYGISDDYLKKYNTNLSEISRSELNKVIKKYFTPQNMNIIVYADEKKVAEQMKKIGQYSTERVK